MQLWSRLAGGEMLRRVWCWASESRGGKGEWGLKCDSWVLAWASGEAVIPFTWDGRAWGRVNTWLNLKKTKRWKNYDYSTHVCKVIRREFDLFHLMLGAWSVPADKGLWRHFSCTVDEALCWLEWSELECAPAGRWCLSAKLLKLRWVSSTSRVTIVIHGPHWDSFQNRMGRS